VGKTVVIIWARRDFMGDFDLYTRQLVSAATSDIGLQLEGQTRALMEHCFETKLDHVRLHFSEASGEANRAFGSLAFAVDGHICLLPEFETSGGEAYTRVLAHEIAHVIQKKLGIGDRRDRGASARVLEREAERAAAQVLCGERVLRLTPDGSKAPRCWDIEGHYYTILWVALEAGLSLKDACRVAFFAQFPDQVKELDAIPEGFHWVERYGEFTALNTMMGEYWVYEKLSALSEQAFGSSKAAPWIREYWENQMLEVVEHCQHNWEIQAGLHSLTGRDAEEETTKRKNILDHIKQPDTFEFGLAVHAYGDSFAHRVACNPPVMYAAPLGHALKGHAADMINRRRSDYSRYAFALLDLFKTRWGTVGPHGPEVLELNNKIDRISGLTNPAVQIDLLVKLADDAWKLGPHYESEKSHLRYHGIDPHVGAWIWRPAADSVPWIDFQRTEAGTFGGRGKSWLNIDLSTDTNVKTASRCASVWCEGARLAGMPAFNDELYLDNLAKAKVLGWFSMPQYEGQVPEDEERRKSQIPASGY
jgi:hypothetical protein